MAPLKYLMVACFIGLSVGVPLLETSLGGNQFKPTLNGRALQQINNIKYSDCDKDQISILSNTATDVHTMTKQMQTDFNKNNEFVQAFWPKSLMDDTWMTYGKQFYKRAGSKLRINDNNPDQLTISCDECGPTNRYVGTTVATTNSITFCNEFFFDEMTNAKDIQCEDGKPLPFYNSRERVLLHELTHTLLAPWIDGGFPTFPHYEGPTEDVSNAEGTDAAYEPQKAKDLAAGQFYDLAPEKARVNADNWALMAWGNLVRETCVARTGKKEFSVPVV